MKVLVAGATGALGKQLVPRLVAGGHEVAGMTRSAPSGTPFARSGRRPSWSTRSTPRPWLGRWPRRSPRSIVHELTALAGSLDMRHFDRDFALDQPAAHRGDRPSARRRPGGGRAAGSWRRATPAGRSPATAARSRPRTIRSIPRRPGRCAGRSRRSAISRTRSRAPDWTEGVVLRYGGFYGPGHLARRRTASTSRRSASGKFPVVGDGAGVWSFVHIEDAAEATVAAVERGRRGHLQHRRRRAGARRASGCRPRRRRSAPSRRGSVPRWLGRAARRRGGDGHDDRGARSLERQGEARAGLAAAAPELARGLRRGGRVSDRTTSCSTSSGRRHSRSPTGCSAAWPRRRTSCRRRCCASTALSRRASGSSRRARTWRRSPRGSRSTSCARRGCGARPTWASGCPEPLRRGPERRPGAPGRDGRLALARLPRPAREPVARAARGAAAARRVRLRLRRDRRDRRQERGQHPPARRARAPARGGAAGRASRPRASSATSSAGASLPPRRRATSAALEALLADDVVLHGDGGGKVPALARALHGRDARRAHAGGLDAAGRPDRRRGDPPGRGQRPAGRAPARRRGRRDQRDGARHRRRADPGRSARSSTPTSSGTSGPWRTWRSC